MNNTPSTTWQHLAPNPKSAYRQLFVKGTRIRARDLFGMYKNASEPMTAEEIAADFDLPVEAVKEAISYCKSDPPEIALDRVREEQLMNVSGMKDPQYPYGGKFRRVPPAEVARILK